MFKILYCNTNIFTFSLSTFTFTPAKVRIVFSQQCWRKQCDDKYTLDCLQLIEVGREDSTYRVFPDNGGMASRRVKHTKHWGKFKALKLIFFLSMTLTRVISMIFCVVFLKLLLAIFGKVLGSRFYQGKLLPLASPLYLKEDKNIYINLNSDTGLVTHDMWRMTCDS